LGEVLSQAEIEALLAGLPREREVEERPTGTPAGTAPKQERERRIREYNFRSPNKFSRDQLRALQMVHEAFGRQLSNSFAATLRTPASFDIVSTQQLPYREFMELLTQSILYIFSAPPLEGPMLLEISMGLGIGILERLLGGFGQLSHIDRPLTDIERTVLGGVAERMLDSLANAWSAMLEMHPRIEGTETDPQFVQIVQPSETIVAVLFEVKIGDQTGTMNLCLPCVTLEPIAPRLSAQQWLTSTRRPATDETKNALASRLRRTQADLSVELGEATLSVSELVGLKPGDVIVLDRRKDDHLLMKVGGRSKFYVRPGRRGPRSAVRISSIIQAPLPDEEELSA